MSKKEKYIFKKYFKIPNNLTFKDFILDYFSSYKKFLNSHWVYSFVILVVFVLYSLGMMPLSKNVLMILFSIIAFFMNYFEVDFIYDNPRFQLDVAAFGKKFMKGLLYIMIVLIFISGCASFFY